MGDRMTALDAAFYYLERTGQLLHVGGVYTVEGSLDFRRLMDDIQARLHLIPRYTQRVVPVPFNLSHPTWEPDPRFSLRNHVFRHTLRAPGDDEQLARLVSRLFAEPLDRTRPLWEMHLIDGYRGDRSALFAKVHHCMIDGVSGVQLLGVMFDASPNPPPPPPSEGLSPAPPLPSPLVQLGRALGDGVRDARAMPSSTASRKPSGEEATISVTRATAMGGRVPEVRARAQDGPAGRGSSPELLVVGHPPAVLLAAHGQQPAALEAVGVLHPDVAAVEEVDGLVALGALLEQPVVHGRLAGRLVDRLALHQLDLLLDLVAREPGGDPEARGQVDAHVVGVEKALGGPASGGRVRSAPRGRRHRQHDEHDGGTAARPHLVPSGPG